MSAPLFDPTGLDPRSATDEQRAEGPLARTPEGTWIVLGHEEAARVATDPETFSSAVSRFLQIPNGLDGADHTAMRAATDPYFAPAEMAKLEPAVREIARDLVEELTADVGAEGTEVDAVSAIGAVFAVRAQTSWLGWSSELEGELLQWMVDNHVATRSGDLARTREVAERFDAIIGSVLAPRRAAGGDAPDDVTTRLMRQTVSVTSLADQVAGTRSGERGTAERELREEEIVSILRNWTGGDLGSIALCTGVLLTGLAQMPAVAERVRAGSYTEACAIVDELLRIDDPFVSNRRVATCPVTLAGQEISPGDRLAIHWTSANRDQRTFGDPDRFDPEGNASQNLVWGTGKHVCPGRPLATMELVVLLQELLAVADVAPAGTAGRRAVAPTGGWSHAPVLLTPRA